MSNAQITAYIIQKIHNSMNFNWGTGIVIFFSFFAISMVSLVVATAKHPPQMVQKDYYALDLNYQAHLEKKQNAASLNMQPEVSFDAATQVVQVSLPEGMVAQSGTAKCYRSATTRDDVVVKIENAASAAISAEKFPAGRWHAELDWTDADGKNYFWETVFFVTKN